MRARRIFCARPKKDTVYGFTRSTTHNDVLPLHAPNLSSTSARSRFASCAYMHMRDACVCPSAGLSRPLRPITHVSHGTWQRGRPTKLVVVVVVVLFLAEALVFYLRGLGPLSRRVVAPMTLCDGCQLRCVPAALARPALRGWVERAPPRRMQRLGGLLVGQPPAASPRIKVASVLLAHLVRVFGC
jgi:hypothetical protein